MRAVVGTRRPTGSGRVPGSRVIAFATWLLALLGAGLMYVSFDAQYGFVLAQKGAKGASLIEAAMLDAGMVILSALGIGLARAGKPSSSVRFLIVICASAWTGRAAVRGTCAATLTTASGPRRLRGRDLLPPKKAAIPGPLPGSPRVRKPAAAGRVAANSHRQPACSRTGRTYLAEERRKLTALSAHDPAEENDDQPAR